jgi:hypothetical protein
MIVRMGAREEDEKPTLPKVATVHEKTVTRAAEHAAQHAVRPARTRSESRQSARLTTSVTVHPDVLRAALKLAGGDASRLTILSATEVRVS